MQKPTTVAGYIDSAPEPARERLRAIRAILKEVAPEATEALKWGHPVLEEKRILFSYSAHRAHLNFTPTGPSLEPFLAELAEYRTSKDTIHFPYDRPLPAELIRKIAAHRAEDVRDNDARWMY